VLLLALGVYVWALLSTGSSTFARALVWREADVSDQERFPARTIAAPPASDALPSRPDPKLERTIDERLGSDTRSFLVVRNGRLSYERYFDGAGEAELETSFSVAKSIVSTLIGIAITDGLVSSVDDPVTRYVPELALRDPEFEAITLRDLMTMTSGLRYEESGLPWAGDDTLTYYGVDLREAALDRTEIETAPGEDWLYNNYNPLLLGLVLERATDGSVSEYMSTELWRPLGAEADATWNLDSDDSGFEKLESGLNATPRDYARFGLLFADDGRAEGRRVVPRGWIREATATQTATDHESGYGYFWWTDARRPGSFYALGNYGQYIYVAPRSETVIVRTGSDWGLDNDGWLNLFRDLSAPG
jgi:CubicO group peptidase (beta-lactamase class C family)